MVSHIVSWYNLGSHSSYFHLSFHHNVLFCGMLGSPAVCEIVLCAVVYAGLHCAFLRCYVLQYLMWSYDAFVFTLCCSTALPYMQLSFPCQGCAFLRSSAVLSACGRTAGHRDSLVWALLSSLGTTLCCVTVWNIVLLLAYVLLCCADLFFPVPSSAILHSPAALCGCKRVSCRILSFY